MITKIRSRGDISSPRDRRDHRLLRVFDSDVVSEIGLRPLTAGLKARRYGGGLTDQNVKLPLNWTMRPSCSSDGCIQRGP